MMKLADDLKAAKALIDTPEKCKSRKSIEGSIIRDAIDEACDPFSGVDFANCLVALREAAEVERLIPWERAATHADIMALFDRAIAKAEQQS